MAVDVAPAEGRLLTATKTVLRIALSVAVFGAVLWYIDAPRFATLLAGAAPQWLALALLASFSAIYLASRTLAALCGGSISPRAVFRVNLISVYTSVFVPGDLVAGLLSRMRYLGLPSWQEVVQRTVVERLVGFACFSVIAGAAFGASAFQAVWGSKAMILPTGVLIAAVVALVVMRHGPKIAVRHSWLRSILSRVAPRSPMAPFAMTPAVFAWSLGSQLCACLVPLALLRALGVPIAYADAIVIAFMIMLAHLVPFFVAGIGIRDVSAVVMLGALGIAAEVAVAFSTLFLFIILALALAGGLLQIGAERRR